MSYTIELKYFKNSICDFLFSQKTFFKGVVLDVGCGDMPYRESILASCAKVDEYIGLDLEPKFASRDRKAEPDMVWDGTNIPLPDKSVDCAFATEVLEHCPDPRVQLSAIHRVLKPGGCFLFTVPFLWPLHETPYDFYRYTPFALHRLFEETGFEAIDIRMLGGWDASLAQMLGLWLVRRPNISVRKRKLLTILLTPIINYLQRKDTISHSFNEQQMCTGFCGIVIKR